MILIVALVWPLVGCVGVLTFRLATRHGIELIYVVLGMTLGPVLLILWALDVLRLRMGRGFAAANKPVPRNQNDVLMLEET
jgi:hypothetical protein